jgi:hypothetical protein
MTAFFGVHLVLTAASLALGTAIGILGIRGMRSARPDPAEQSTAPINAGHATR